MVKKYVEITLVCDDDPATNPNNIVEQSSRVKEEGGEWSEPEEAQPMVPHFWLDFPCLQVEVVKKEVE